MSTLLASWYWWSPGSVLGDMWPTWASSSDPCGYNMPVDDIKPGYLGGREWLAGKVDQGLVLEEGGSFQRKWRRSSKKQVKEAGRDVREESWSRQWGIRTGKKARKGGHGGGWREVQKIRGREKLRGRIVKTKKPSTEAGVKNCEGRRKGMEGLR